MKRKRRRYRTVNSTSTNSHPSPATAASPSTTSTSTAPTSTAPTSTASTNTASWLPNHDEPQIEHSPASITSPPPAATATSPSSPACEPNPSQPEPNAPLLNAPLLNKSKLDAVAKVRLCELISIGKSIKDAARIVGVSERAVYYAKDRDEQFRQQLIESREDASGICLQTLKQAAKENWRAALHYLKVVQPERFERRTANHATTADNRQAQQLLQEIRRLLSTIMTDEQLEEFNRRLSVG